LKERSERIKGGSVLERGKRPGGMGKTTIFFLPPSRYRTEETGRSTGGRGEGRRRPRPWGWPGSGAKRRGARGNRFRSLPWAGVLWRGGSTVGGGAARGGGRGGTGGGDGGLGKEGELVVEVRGEVGSQSGPFIGAGRSVWRGYFELRGAPMAGNGSGEKYLGVDLGLASFRAAQRCGT
jgi:hypothetical protein